MKILGISSLNINNRLLKVARVCRMSAKHNLIKPPECVQDMKELDKSKFETVETVPILNLKDVYVSNVLPYIKKYCFKMRHINPIKYLNNDNKQRYILLNKNIKNWLDFAESDRDILTQHSITETDLSCTNITITYDNYSADEIFKAIFPKNQEGFSSFSQIGHIIHLNLREHMLPYKRIIGQVLLDKISRTRTVVNKLDMIDNTYRNFEMEIICGVDDMMVNIKENRCDFEFDFSKVYWNPRLSTERERIAETLSGGDILFDVFAGVGPFSIPAAKKGCIVYANDLNPESYKWLNHNRKKNRIDVHRLSTYNKDGRDFIKEELKDNLLKHINNYNISIVMNLPALAVEFLSSFNKLYNESELNDVINPPILHVYCFAKGEDVMNITKNLINEHMGFDVEDKIINIFRVRTVSNFKEMMRVSIKLDKDILVGLDSGKRKSISSVDAESLSKKICHGKEQNEANEECN